MLTLLAALALCPVQDVPAPEPAGPLDNVVVIGASMSAGFALRGELDANFNLARTLELAIKSPGSQVHSLASSYLFSDPRNLGAKQVQEAKALEPTLVVALDFPFWFGYGSRLSCESRLKRLERCLEQLGGFECPVLLGDFPDMTAAAGGPNDHREGKAMISHSQIPSAECFTRLNTRVRQWAAEREKVYVYPLAAYTAKLFNEEPVHLRGNTYDAERKKSLMQRDRLHPTYRGTVATALGVLDTLAVVELIAEDSVEWDSTAVERAVWKATEAERTESRRRRAERDAKRKAREKEGAGEGGQRLMRCG